MRRALLVLAVALAGVGLLTGGLAWLLNDPRPQPGASRGERLYVSFCVGCHGVDGRGSWRAALFLIRPGDLTAGTAQPERYVFDLIKHGGASIGRPGMPAFGAQLSDEEIRELVVYVRSLPARRTSEPARSTRD